MTPISEKNMSEKAKSKIWTPEELHRQVAMQVRAVNIMADMQKTRILQSQVHAAPKVIQPTSAESESILQTQLYFQALTYMQCTMGMNLVGAFSAPLLAQPLAPSQPPPIIKITTQPRVQQEEGSILTPTPAQKRNGSGGEGAPEHSLNPAFPNPPLITNSHPTHRILPNGSTQKLCTVRECGTFAKKRGLCVKHGGAARCAYDGCTTNARMNKLCGKHFRMTSCKEEGCTKKVICRQGFCGSHVPYNLCTERGCTSKAVERKLCVRHGAHGTCAVDACSAKAIGRGLCLEHGAHGSCRRSECTAVAKTARGYCEMHGAWGKCAIAWCTNPNAKRQGRCQLHAQRGNELAPNVT